VTRPMPDLTHLPGAELVLTGLADARAGGITAASLLLACATRRLTDLGLEALSPGGPDAGLRLYQHLAESDPEGAHARYNAPRSRLVSFFNALEADQGWERRRVAGEG
jgi:hypothetical protein